MAPLPDAEDGLGERERLSALSDLYLEILQTQEAGRLAGAKMRVMRHNEARYHELNHHFNVTAIRRENGPRFYGLHMTYKAHCQYRRGSRAKWGTCRRTIGRLGWLNKAADP
uniref:Uncharacterized protein n=1 Tax=Pyrodinium bahamense TaxID=73915 RepID=A0A7R9ZW47_9DINO